MTTNEFDDGLGFEDEETPSERLGRELAEADLQLIAQIRAKRIERGLKQAELAKLLGISQATVSEFESGMTEPRMQTVRRYARALGIMIEHRVRDADMSYSSSGISVETRVRPGVQYTLGRALGPYTAAANSKPTDFALVA
ncbi:helix-turn-helix domain-containing protein [Curtobacterium flaccumfaciens]|uniref:helix-turn-helix domain-containing protein n=1 Tax=Curtobacterium flaccumfaciens TaxID=2035 RepID=UPI001BDE19B5|nr:helix-turn-helix domain-containing protein [Curtobacterium flaccumfaciens]MBT1631490.1 helix-turn-helix transcriptional regulator [Curtobacterium flaccumfaciens pv. oortii]MCX2846798.1 helix-turn-helix domain-containing protein [Curtobacterium flaccumfaciens pv. oortii]